MFVWVIVNFNTTRVVTITMSKYAYSEFDKVHDSMIDYMADYGIREIQTTVCGLKPKIISYMEYYGVDPIYLSKFMRYKHDMGGYVGGKEICVKTVGNTIEQSKVSVVYKVWLRQKRTR